jgi:hypothetical protein
MGGGFRETGFGNGFRFCRRPTTGMPPATGLWTDIQFPHQFSDAHRRPEFDVHNPKATGADRFQTSCKHSRRRVY